jgi:hypothetical protein
MGKYDDVIDTGGAPAVQTRGKYDDVIDAPPEIAPQLDPGHIDPRTMHWVPDKRTQAVFTGPNAPTGPMTADQLRDFQANSERYDIPRKKATAFVGGALQGATFKLGDELSAGVGALTGQGGYSQLRNEQRKANKDVEQDSPPDYALGNLAGGAMTAFVPGVAPVGRLLTGANTLRAAGAGAAQAFGESEGDVEKSVPAAIEGGAVGAAVNTALGGLGAGVRAGKNYLSGLPTSLAKKADETLIDAATLGAPASKRDALMGYLGQDRPDVLKLIREHPEIEQALKAGDRPAAAKILTEARAQQSRIEEGTVQTIQGGSGPAQVAPIIAKLEAKRDAAKAIPSIESQMEANKTQKLIDLVKERWIPEPPLPEPKGPELLAKLAEKADTGDKQRIGTNADAFLKVAEKHKLGEVANDPIATDARLGESLAKLGERREKLYDQVKEPMLITDMTRPLAAWRDELASVGGTVPDAANVDKLMKNIWSARGKNGALTMTPLEARAEISAAQSKAFAGAYIDPGQAKEMQRKAAGIMKDALDQHVERATTVPAVSRIGAETVRPSNALPDEPGYMYHATNLERARPIGKEGIAVHRPDWGTDQDVWPDGSKQLRSYWSPRASNVWQFAPEEGAPVVLRTPKEAHPFKAEGTGDFYATKPVPPEKVEILTKDGWTPIQEWSGAKVPAATPSRVGQDLAQLNQEYSALLTFKTAAEKRAAEARLLSPPLPETRTGTAPIADVRELARTTEDVPTRQELTAGLHEQLSPEQAQQLTALERRRDLMERLQAPLEIKAGREASPPTTGRHHLGKIKEFIEQKGSIGLGSAGLALTAAGQHLAGGSVLALGLVSRYGPAMGAKAERALSAMVTASRLGAGPAHLKTIARAAGVTSKIASELIGTLAPRVAAEKVVNP